MTQKIIQRNHVHPVFRIVLLFILIVCGALLITAIAWIFNKIHNSIGLELAQVTIAIICILTLILILIGLSTGLGLDQFIQQQNVRVWRVYQSSSQVRSFLNLLGYEEVQSEYEETVKSAISDPAELASSFSNITSRRGRPPTYSLERWTKVVLAWEKRDPLRNPMTLAEFLGEQFGENADGSPRISENCFYTNRKKVISELQKGIKVKNDS